MDATVGVYFPVDVGGEAVFVDVHGEGLCFFTVGALHGLLPIGEAVFTQNEEAVLIVFEQKGGDGVGPGVQTVHGFMGKRRCLRGACRESIVDEHLVGQGAMMQLLYGNQKNGASRSVRAGLGD